MNLRKIILMAAAASVLAGGLSACREDEQNRPLSYAKGIYGGAADEPLGEEQQRALQRRGYFQQDF